MISNRSARSVLSRFGLCLARSLGGLFDLSDSYLTAWYFDEKNVNFVGQLTN